MSIFDSCKPDAPNTWPEYLRDRPMDLRRKLPIPAVSVFGDKHDFNTVNGDIAYELAKNRVCGVCSKTMGYWVAFIGGSLALANRQFTTPPMHPECAEASLKLCPHINIQRMKRRTGDPLGVGSEAPEWLDTNKPDKWFFMITRTYKVRLIQHGTKVTHIIDASPFKTIRTFVYLDSVLTEFG